MCSALTVKRVQISLNLIKSDGGSLDGVAVRQADFSRDGYRLNSPGRLRSPDLK